MNNNNNIDVRGYYQSLGKKEKGMLLDYLLIEYGLKTNTIRRKLAFTQFGELSRLESMAIQDAIISEKWKQLNSEQIQAE